VKRVPQLCPCGCKKMIPVEEQTFKRLFGDDILEPRAECIERIKKEIRPKPDRRYGPWKNRKKGSHR
jgi:hypothetical protein